MLNILEYCRLESLPNSCYDPGEEARRPQKGRKLVFPEDAFYNDYLFRHPEVCAVCHINFRSTYQTADYVCCSLLVLWTERLQLQSAVR